MFYDPRHDDHGLPHNPWMALIVPRPIGWISTVDQAGIRNLAPYSAFNTISSRPPFVMFSSDGDKDSIINAEATGFFCVNIATFELREAMNRSSAPYPPEIDEFAAAGLTAVPCENIPCPRVAEAPVSIECMLSQIILLTPASGAPCTNRIAIGEVVGIHIDERVLRNGRVDSELLQPLGRMGYRDYTVSTRAFEMIRPVLDES
ncbi:MAG: flavin reductase family protein [Rhizobiaceae bacterium]|nr:flavin reductase family protein [Rhizobiaceae bacterium]